MATTTDKDETTIEVEIDGKKTGPITMNEFEDRTEAALDRLRDEPPQLSFDLGTGRRDSPDFGSLKIAGQASVSRDLRYGESVTVTVVDRHGEIVAEVPATCGYPAFKDHFDKYGTKTVERIHTASLD